MLSRHKMRNLALIEGSGKGYQNPGPASIQLLVHLKSNEKPVDRLFDSLLPQRTKYLLQFGKSVNSFLASRGNNSNEGPGWGSVSISGNP